MKFYTIGIETSCDETAVALIDERTKVLSNIVSSQIPIHEEWGGVIPEIASRKHTESISAVFTEALKQAGLKVDDIDLIGVTQGPGLVGSLLVGAMYAKGLSLATSKPLIPVNHVHAHIHGALLAFEPSKVPWPLLGLVVSGGHTNLYYMANELDFQLIGHSIDDACGESFDKVGKILGLPYPGGPHIEIRAKTGNDQAFSLPKSMSGNEDLNFSFSGLKTAVSMAARSVKSDQQVSDLAASFQTCALDQINRKVHLSLKRFPEIKGLLVAGGVSANQKLKELLANSFPFPILCPELKYCGDNGAMIARLALKTHQNNNDLWKDINWDVYSRYNFESKC